MQTRSLSKIWRPGTDLSGVGNLSNLGYAMTNIAQVGTNSSTEYAWSSLHKDSEKVSGKEKCK